MTRAALLLGLCACGRLSFAPSSGDGGASDVLADDAFVADATMQATCNPQHGVCDLFDSTTINSAVWTTGGTVTIDTAIAHRGTSSVRFDVPALPANTQFGSYVVHISALVSGATQLWMRAWVRMSALPASTNALELISLQQSSGLGNFVFARSNDTQLYGQFASSNANGNVAPPVDTWFCIVFDVQLSTTNTGSLGFTSDVLPAMSIPNTVTQGAPGVDEVVFGPYFAANNVDVPQPAFSVWMDDVIIHTAPVTCAE